MTKNSPKKVMEIIFIFILPLFVVLCCLSFRKIGTETPDEILDGFYYETTYYFEYDNNLVRESPIRDVLNIVFDLLGYDTSNNIVNIIIDYNSLWFTNFIIWHLLYLFFDTIMHKVLLRKE